MMVRTILASMGAMVGMGAAWAAGWQAETSGAYTARTVMGIAIESGTRAPGLELAYPARSVSQPGEAATWRTTLASPAGSGAVLRFRATDTFTGPTVGYHVLQVIVDDQVVWERDVAGEDDESRLVELPLPAGATTLAFRLIGKRTVTNFPVRVTVSEAAVCSGGRTVELMPAVAPASTCPQWPRDLPSPALAPIGEWTWAAGVVQPWGQTQTVAVKQVATWAPRFARELGFNAIIMLPPAAHNAITGALDDLTAPDHVTDEEFAAAVDAYRREGMRFILYTAIMHSGHDPEWQLGRLFQSHPDWSMRDPDGGTVNTYGNPWLCPSSPALDYTLDYTVRLVERYNADAVMLDNNEFLTSANGEATCYCEYCQKAFAGYVRARCDDRWLHDALDIDATRIAIPLSEDDPLWGVWLSWRNRVWGEACERFRERLREVKPGTAVMANTQYVFADWMLAVDGQYGHLDAVLSESRGLDGPGMAAKMMLGRALTSGRPLWNYIGTFDEDDFTRLRSPGEVAANCAASYAVGANPWVVSYGFEGEENRESMAAIERYTAFGRSFVSELSAGTLQGEAGWLFSTESRDLAGQALIPAAMTELIRDGYALRGLREGWTGASDLQGLKVLMAPQAECMREQTARDLAEWVRQGGCLAVRPLTSWRDEYGCWRTEPALATACGSRVTAVGEHRVGKGLVISSGSDEGLRRALAGRVPPLASSDGSVGAFHHMGADGRHALALAGFSGPIGRFRTRLPFAAAKVTLHVPGHDPVTLPVTERNGHRYVEGEADAYLALLVPRP